MIASPPALRFSTYPDPRGWQVTVQEMPSWLHGGPIFRPKSDGAPGKYRRPHQQRPSRPHAPWSGGCSGDAEANCRRSAVRGAADEPVPTGVEQRPIEGQVHHLKLMPLVRRTGYQQERRQTNEVSSTALTGERGSPGCPSRERLSGAGAGRADREDSRYRTPCGEYRRSSRSIRSGAPRRGTGCAPESGG
jgi:hypothetical protein